MACTENAMVPSSEHAPPPAMPQVERNPLDVLRKPALSVLTNMNLADPEVQNRVSKAMASGDVDLAAANGKVFSVVGYMAHVVPVTVGEEGEIEERARVVLFDKEGGCFSWVSAHTTKYWVGILGLKGQGPWPEGIKVQVTRHPGKKQGHWYSLALANDVPARKPKA